MEALLKHSAARLIPRQILFLLAMLSVVVTAPSLSATTNETVTLTAQRMSSNQYQFSFQGKVGRTYPVAVSTDLVHWAPLTNLAGADATLSVQDTQVLNFPRHYYHLGLHPTPITNMVWIPPGVFTMGSPTSEVGRASIEGPQTIVTLTQGFWMGKFEVTQQEWTALFQANALNVFVDPPRPLDSRSWSDATNYCAQLTAKESAAGHLPPGWIYRLPTEAEWEYAARAGSSAPFGIGDGNSLSSAQANFDGGFPYGGAPKGAFLGATMVGGSYPPNRWGLYDMNGNVWEWVQDFYGPYPGGSVTDPKGPTTGSSRVARGGNYDSTGNLCRSAKRDGPWSPSFVKPGYGFRIVLARDP